ncbi:277b90b0-29f9-4555-b135-f970c75e88d4 [Sclerotinia trifoliorum]|uniref:277b90b0-29f9-4555-b135-f970c75e88d4 n=1 Tax=Sclerotinia trifoliorum TaxID=28548 RepID=A0A8H2VQ67_9HELO|nr:277b90b0-29f9-4555-b135-f970c75e88d4 [Sclerotinia trifoliorum]
MPLIRTTVSTFSTSLSLLQSHFSVMAQVPAIAPPAGHIAFGRDETLWKWNVLCICVCLSFTTIGFLLRTYVRACIRREWAWEDYMTCVSYAGFVLYCALMTTVMHNYGGVHEWDLTVSEVQDVVFWFNVTSIEYGIEILFTKLTILTIYRRVFVPHRWSKFDMVLRLFEGILILFYFAISVVKIFECTPRARIWNKSLPGTCVDVSKLLNTSGLFNFTTDVLILLIPVKSVWNLQMKKKRKLSVVLIFTFGMIAPVFSMVGFLVREDISKSPDVTYNQPLVLLWGTAEVSTGFICVCLPPLTILFHKQEPRGPSQSILHGESNGVGGSGQQKTKRKPKFRSDNDTDLLTGQYIELEEASSYTLGVEKPNPTYKIGVSGGATSSEQSREEINTSGNAQDIIKTVKIHQSFT